jgi:tetratricopeptide (TPR) repeat protein
VSSRDQAQDDDGFGEASRYTAHLDRGWSLLDRGDFQHARTSAQQALELRPDVPDAAMLLAAISLAESDPEASLEWYERAIETDAEYVDAQLAAAQVLLYDLEQPERALARAGQACRDGAAAGRARRSEGEISNRHWTSRYSRD